MDTVVLYPLSPVAACCHLPLTEKYSAPHESMVMPEHLTWNVRTVWLSRVMMPLAFQTLMMPQRGSQGKGDDATGVYANHSR